MDDGDINRKDTKKQCIWYDAFTKWKYNLNKEFNAVMRFEGETVMECG